MTSPFLKSYDGQTTEELIALEGQYRIVPSDPPTNSVQAFYGESDLGGLAIRAMFSITFGKKAPTTTPKK